MVGDISEVEQKAERLAAEAANQTIAVITVNRRLSTHDSRTQPQSGSIHSTSVKKKSRECALSDNFSLFSFLVFCCVMRAFMRHRLNTSPHLSYLKLVTNSDLLFYI